MVNNLKQISKLTSVFTLKYTLPEIFERDSVKSSLWQRWLSFFSIRSIFTIALAFDQLVTDTCQNSTTFCEQIFRVERQELLKYSNKIEENLDQALFSFGTVDHTGELNDFMYFNGHQFKSKPNNVGLSIPSVCTGQSCATCIKFRQSRDVQGNGDVPVRFDSNYYSRHPHNSFNNLHLLMNEDESAPELASAESEDEPMIHVETHEINVGLLLPLHKAGQSILECSSELNLPAYYVLEAARWIIEKINQNNYLIPGIEIKLELIDTCSSPFYATQELAHLTSSTAKVQPIALVAALPRNHYKQVIV